MNECRSASGESTLHNERIECRDPHLGDCRSIFDRNRGRNAHELVFVDHKLFGVGTSTDDSHHLVANSPRRDSFTECGDSTRELHTGNFGRRRGEPGQGRTGIQPAALQEVSTIECCRHDVDEHFLGTRNGIDHVDQLQDIEFAIAI